MNDHATSFLFGVEQSVSGASWIAPKKAKENLKDPVSYTHLTLPTTPVV